MSEELYYIEDILNHKNNNNLFIHSELGTFEWWISGLRLNPLSFLISRLT